jgi:hypothetical protein
VQAPTIEECISEKFVINPATLHNLIPCRVANKNELVYAEHKYGKYYINYVR